MHNTLQRTHYNTHTATRTATQNTHHGPQQNISKVSSIVILFSKSVNKPTFENVYLTMWVNAPPTKFLKSQLYSPPTW